MGIALFRCLPDECSHWPQVHAARRMRGCLPAICSSRINCWPSWLHSQSTAIAPVLLALPLQHAASAPHACACLVAWRASSCIMPRHLQADCLTLGALMPLHHAVPEGDCLPELGISVASSAACMYGAAAAQAVHARRWWLVQSPWVASLCPIASGMPTSRLWPTRVIRQHASISDHLQHLEPSGSMQCMQQAQLLQQAARLPVAPCRWHHRFRSWMLFCSLSGLSGLQIG
jgi:hypothetical protein